MVNTENPYNQVERIKNNFEVSNHTLLNSVISGLRGEIKQIHPDLVLQLANKKSVRGEVSLILKGQVTLDDSEDVKDKVKQLINSLKNPSNLISLLSRNDDTV